MTERLLSLSAEVRRKGVALGVPLRIPQPRRLNFFPNRESWKANVLFVAAAVTVFQVVFAGVLLLCAELF